MRRGATNPADTKAAAQPTLGKRKRPSKYIDDSDFGGGSGDEYEAPGSESDEDDDDEEFRGPATAPKKVEQNENKTRSAEQSGEKTGRQRKIRPFYHMVHGEYRAEERDETPDLEDNLEMQRIACSRRGQVGEEEAAGAAEGEEKAAVRGRLAGRWKRGGGEGKDGDRKGGDPL